MAAIRCKCGQFLTKENRCNRCEVVYEPTGTDNFGAPEYRGSDGVQYCAVNNRIQYIHRENPKPKEEKKMSFFSFDENKAGGQFDPLQPGEYEAIVSKTEVKTSRSGNPMISVQLTIRNDVEQDYANRKVFDNYVATEAAMFKFHQVAKALGWEQGKAVDSLNDFAAEIQYQPVRLKIGAPRKDDRGNDSTNIQTYLPSQVSDPTPGVISQDPFAADGKPVDISDDDLPF